MEYENMLFAWLLAAKKRACYTFLRASQTQGKRAAAFLVDEKEWNGRP